MSTYILKYKFICARFYSPVAHTPYLEAREMDAQRRKIHPQDVDILMSFLASK